METLENSSHQWDRLWANKVTNFYPRLPAFHIVDNFIRKHLHFNAIDNLLGSFLLKGKDIIEFGSGTGSNSFYLAKSHKAKTITLVDFSQKALARAKKKTYPCPTTRIQEDLLKFLPGQGYDFVHSTGLVEHFAGGERLLVVKKHAQCVRPNGMVMIWVPIFSPAFKIIAKINHYLGIREIPFTKHELQFLCRESGLEIINEKKAVFGALYGILAKKIAKE